VATGRLVIPDRDGALTRSRFSLTRNSSQPL